MVPRPLPKFVHQRSGGGGGSSSLGGLVPSCRDFRGFVDLLSSLRHGGAGIALNHTEPCGLEPVLQGLCLIELGCFQRLSPIVLDVVVT